MPFSPVRDRSFRRGFRVLSAGKSRDEKFSPALYSASEQAYVSFRPPNARTRLRLLTIFVRFARTIFSPPHHFHPLPRRGGQLRRSHTASSATRLLYWACSPA